MLKMLKMLKMIKMIKNENFVIKNIDEIELKTMFRILTSITKKLQLEKVQLVPKRRYHYNLHMLKI